MFWRVCGAIRADTGNPPAPSLINVSGCARLASCLFFELSSAKAVVRQKSSIQYVRESSQSTWMSPALASTTPSPRNATKYRMSPTRRASHAPPPLSRQGTPISLRHSFCRAICVAPTISSTTGCEGSAKRRSPKGSNQSRDRASRSPGIRQLRILGCVPRAALRGADIGALTGGRDL